MIRVDRNGVLEPQILIDNNKDASGEKSLAILYYECGGKKIPDFKIYSNKAVKKALSTLFNKKCAYCESIIYHISFSHIEHWRPKKGVTEDATHKGYYWLASEWDNLLLACPCCNSDHKKNKFPIDASSTYARKSSDDYEALEKPLLLNPCKDYPEQHIEYTEKGAIKGLSVKGKKSIEVYGLDRIYLTLERRKICDVVTMILDDILEIIYDLAMETKAIGKEIPSDERPNSIKRKKNNLLKKRNLLRGYVKPTFQYSAMSKYIIKKYRQKEAKNKLFLKFTEDLI
jgi:uncharacterized protein (TIGR02646 family)